LQKQAYVTQNEKKVILNHFILGFVSARLNTVESITSFLYKHAFKPAKIIQRRHHNIILDDKLSSIHGKRGYE